MNAERARDEAGLFPMLAIAIFKEEDCVDRRSLNRKEVLNNQSCECHNDELLTRRVYRIDILLFL